MGHMISSMLRFSCKAAILQPYFYFTKFSKKAELHEKATRPHITHFNSCNLRMLSEAPQHSQLLNLSTFSKTQNVPTHDA